MNNPEGVFFGAFLLLFGIGFALWPYRIARFSEQLDAIGSKRRWSDVEPADWHVWVTRYGGIALAVVGAFAILINL